MDAWATTLERLDEQGLRRSLRRGGAGPTLPGANGESIVNLASNDYLGLATDPRVRAAAARAAERYGIGAGASRLITGSTEAHEALETALAASRGTEAALVFSSGYATNVGVLQALAGRHDVIVADALCHASILDGARLSGARLLRYRHDDLDDLSTLLESHRAAPARFVVTEGVFSMEGTLADLGSIAPIARASDATLIVDDAHGTGVTGPGGRGSVAAAGLDGDDVPVQIGTLSKALGAQGGYVAGSQTLIDLMLQRARSLVFSTGLSPALAAAAHASLEIAIGPDGDSRRAQMRAHVATLRGAFAAAGAEILGETAAPMTLAVLGEADRVVAASTGLEAAGILAAAIRPPTVPVGTSRLRCAPMATQTDEQITQAAGAIREVLGR